MSHDMHHAEDKLYYGSTSQHNYVQYTYTQYCSSKSIPGEWWSFSWSWKVFKLWISEECLCVECSKCTSQEGQASASPTLVTSTGTHHSSIKCVHNVHHPFTNSTSTMYMYIERASLCTQLMLPWWVPVCVLSMHSTYMSLRKPPNETSP